MPNDMDFIVRKLSSGSDERDKDIAGIKTLCSDRSYLGKDIAEVFSYRDLWADLVIDPYLELSPEHVWVAQDNETGEMLGYLTGAVREDFYSLQDRFVSDYIHRLSKRGLLDVFFSPVRYFGSATSVLKGLDHRTIEFLRYLKTRAREEIPKRPETPHFNVFARYDNRGIARALIGAYLQELRQRAVPRFHITALHVPGDRLRRELEKKGFRVRSLDFFRDKYSIYDCAPTNVFAPYELTICCFEREVPALAPSGNVTISRVRGRWGGRGSRRWTDKGSLAKPDRF
jgi:GNAT superfamily N-acetyltransferase